MLATLQGVFARFLFRHLPQRQTYRGRIACRVDSRCRRFSLRNEAALIRDNRASALKKIPRDNLSPKQQLPAGAGATSNFIRFFYFFFFFFVVLLWIALGHSSCLREPNPMLSSRRSHGARRRRPPEPGPPVKPSGVPDDAGLRSWA